MLKLIMPTHLERGVVKKKKIALNLNVYRNLHFQVSNDLKIIYKKIVGIAVNGFPPFKGPVKLKLIYFNGTNRKSDLENNCIVHVKFLLDALVEFGIIKTDDFDTVKKIEFIYGGYKKNDGYVNITVENS